MCMCVREFERLGVCVCVYVRQRERKRARARNRKTERQRKGRYVGESKCVCVCVCRSMYVVQFETLIKSNFDIFMCLKSTEIYVCRSIQNKTLCSIIRVVLHLPSDLV